MFFIDRAAIAFSDVVYGGVSNVMDQLRVRFGDNTLALGKHDALPGGYVGAKIVSGLIPDADDFEATLGEDRDTHFCFF